MSRPSHQHQQQQTHRGRAQRGRDRRPATAAAAAAASAAAAVTTALVGCSVCKTGAANYKCPKCRAIYCSIACCRRHKQEQCSASSSTVDEKKQDENSSTTNKDEIIITAGGLVGGVEIQAPPPSSKYCMPERANQGSEPVLKRLRLEEQATGSTKPHSRRHYEQQDLEPGWKMTDEMRNAMCQSRWLRQELADPGLQQLISSVVNASGTILPSSVQHAGRPIHRRESGVGNIPTTPQEQLLAQLKMSNPQFRLFIDKLLVTTGVLEVQQQQQQFDLKAWLQGSDCTSPPLQLKPLQRKQVPLVVAANNSAGNESDSTSSSSNDEDSSSGEDDDKSLSSSDHA